MFCGARSLNALYYFYLFIIYLHRVVAMFKEEISPGVFPDDYSKYEPPCNKGSPAHVYIRLYIMDVDKIDEGAMEFSIQIFLDEIWKDTRLNLSGFAETDEPNSIFPTYLAKHIWVPDLVFDNAKKGSIFQLSLPNRSLKVLNGETFIRETRYNMIIGCQMDFRLYPMDIQECFMKILSLAYHDGKVLLHWAEELSSHETESISLMENIQPLKHILLAIEPHKTTEVWSYGNYTCLYANFTFDRRMSGSLLKVYIPSTLVVFLSCISFWLDAESVPARITLGVTSLLTLATQIVQAHDYLPPISYMTAMDVWLFACLITVFSSIVEFAFAYQFINRSEQLSPGDRGSSDILFMKRTISVRAVRSRTRHDSSSKYVNSHQKKSTVPENMPNETVNRQSLDKKCRKLFPLLFFLFCVVYWSYYLLTK